MKNKSKSVRNLGISLLCLACSTGLVRGQDLVAFNFDTDVQGLGYGWGASLVVNWDPSIDASNNLASGTLMVDVDFSGADNYTVIQGNMNIASFVAYDKVRLSVYLDPTNTPASNGNYGSIEFRARPTGWGWPGSAVNMGTITNTGWTHFEKPLPVDMIATSVGVNIAWSSAYKDVRTLRLDNLVFVERTATPPPPSLNLTQAGPGLEIKTTGGPDYARKNIATTDDLAPFLTWLNSTGPVKYSMTINQGVEPAHSPGHTANIMLCAGTDLTINASPDWNQPSGVFMEASQTELGDYYVTVRYKTNTPNSHGIRFEPEGLLIEKTNTSLTSLVGTWSLTLSNDTVRLEGPGGINGNAQLPADALVWFGPGTSLWALFGVQPYLQNDRIISLSQVQVQGGPDFFGNVSQNFLASDTLDPQLRVLQEGSGGGVVLKPTNTSWRIAWGLPDTGMYLWSSPSLAAVDWAYTGLTPITQGMQRTVFMTNVTMAAGYFQLRDSGPPPAAVILESFESGVYAGPNPPYTNIVQSTAAGVTEGTYSMQVNFDASQDWQWLGKTYGADAYTNWYGNTKLVFDLHREPETFGWNLNLAIAINGDMGWNQNEAVAWTWLNAGASETQTITWDYSAIKASAPAPTESSYFQLNFMARGGSGGNVYIDNVRFE